MAGTCIVFEIEGFDKLRRALERASFVDLKKLSSFAAGEMHRIIMEEAFEKESDPVTGKKWEKVQPRRGRRSGPILTDMGLLRDSIEDKSTAMMAEIGTSLVYGRIHNEGGMAGRGRSVDIPQRRFLGYSDRHVKGMLADDYVRNLLEIRP